ncbi:hypothetical protein [Hirschia maritima]|uniref:hypothetical protein n=1 Tax=Hirschia maritima TaxID=1121961 RepID=UPI00039D2191|nr:hypothetical protein [Hirschia maritima]
MTFLFVNEGGEPFNIRAKCDVPKYETAAIQAMSTVKYIPITYNGKPAMRKDVSYPFELLFE